MSERRDEGVVEIDAMDVAEWERDRHTPLAPTEGLAELVKKTADASGPVAAAAAAPAKPAVRKTSTMTVPRVTAPKRDATLPKVSPKPTPAPGSKVPPTAFAKTAPRADPTPVPKPPPPRRATPQPMPVAVAPPAVAPRAKDADSEPTFVAPPVKEPDREPSVVVSLEPPPLEPPPVAKPPPPQAQPILQPSPMAMPKPFAPEPVAVPTRQLTPDEPYLPAGAPSRKRIAIIAGAAGALLLIIVVVAVAASGGSKPAAAPPPDHATAAPPPPPPQQPAADQSLAPASPHASAAVVAKPPATPSPRPAPTAIRRYHKPVVLDYDSGKHPTPASADPGPQDDAALARARTAYDRGNQQLFAGDPEGAIRSYREALAAYPSYVAGYRGLGLAYAQAGDKAQALQAFRTYVSIVPRAKDVVLIKKRMTMLAK